MRFFMLLFLATATKGRCVGKRSKLDPFGVGEKFKEVTEQLEEGVDRLGDVDDISDPFDVIGSRTGNFLELALKGPQAVLNALPDPPFYLPAGPYRRGPYAGICTCLGNIGGCYIDAAKPPPTGFTCKCVKEKGILSGKFYGCAGFGYRLSWREEEHAGELYDRAQCLKGMDSDLPIPSFEGDCGGYYEYFSDYSWGKVQEDVKIRLFAPNSYTPVQLNPITGEGHCSIWEQGEDIHCKLRGEESEIGVPWGFNPNLPVKGFIHGFADDGKFRVDTVPAYNKKFDGNVNVIIVDWSPLARALDIEDTLDNSLYYRGARNSQIVGEYLGRCLAGLSKQTGLRGQNIHLTGHSLGGQMLGTLGPAYEWWNGHLTGRWSEKLGRLTALDPAGPGFVDGDVLADPRLNKARLTPSAATFVDVIHTNSDANGPLLLNIQNPFAMRLGDHSPLGHMDFYPDGVNGMQNECNPKNPQQLCKVACSHERAVQYFIDSINKDCAFPASSETRGVTWDACMGEQAQDYWLDRDPHSVWHTDSSAWLREHGTGLLEDCEFTARFACRILTNIYPDFFDAGFCYKDTGTKCEL